MKRLIAFSTILASLLLLFVTPVRASEPINDCVIRIFAADFELAADASLAVTENLTVDCGSLPDKHGIFRIVPTRAPWPRGVYAETPVTLRSITDFNDWPIVYEASANRLDHTLTWKIGDPDKTIAGLQYYRLRYVVKNAAYSSGDQTVFDWNLTGNFWQLPIDQFTALVKFPVDKSQINHTMYDGPRGSTSAKITTAVWKTDNQLELKTSSTLNPGEGVTLKAALPSGAVMAYNPSFREQYGAWLWFLLPFLMLIGLFILWRRVGDDPNLHQPELVQYAPPAKLSPLELGLLERYGELKPDYVTATLIDLAVRGYVRIEELAKSGLFSHKDWQLVLLKSDPTSLKDYEKFLLEKLFGSLNEGATTKLSDNKNTFYTHLGELKKLGQSHITELHLLDPRSLVWRNVLYGALMIIVFGTFFSFTAVGSPYLGGSLGLTALIVLIFALIMARRTPEGAARLYELRGFKLYLSRAEKYRMEFYEKENIFEKYLPYAIAFGLTSKWLSAFKKIYGTSPSTPVMGWYVGTNAGDFHSFSDSISSLSSQIGQTLGSSPGGSGGGFSGGGGGGGGGGSW